MLLRAFTIAVVPPVEGKITRITYRVPGDGTALEVFRNYEQGRQKVGFSTVSSAQARPVVGLRKTRAGGGALVQLDIVERVGVASGAHVDEIGSGRPLTSPSAGRYRIPDRAGSLLRAHFCGTVP